MTLSKIALKLLIGLCLGFLTLTVASASDSSSAPISWLFVQDASNGSLVGTNDQDLTLTLKGVRLYTSAFSDRPNRLAVAIPNQKFIDDWATAFASSPPNATLSYRRSGEQRPTNIVLTLSAPIYDATKRTITYKAAVVFRTISNQSPNLPGYSIPIPHNFGAASLFIDSIFIISQNNPV